MALIRKNRTLQYPLFADFTFQVTDTMLATDGATRAVGAATGTVFDTVALPPRAVVISGDVTVETASNDGGAATVSIGDALNATRYLGATSTKSAARTALVPTGFRGNGEDIRVTLSNANGDATTGTITLRVGYLVGGRTSETQIA